MKLEFRRPDVWLGLRLGILIVLGLFVFPRLMISLFGSDPDPTLEFAEWTLIGLVIAVVLHALLPRRLQH